MISVFTPSPSPICPCLSQYRSLLSQNGSRDHCRQLHHLCPARLACAVPQHNVGNLMHQDADQLPFVVGVIKQAGVKEDRSAG